MMQLSEPHKENLRWVFKGPDGIRAGWSIAIFLAITIAVMAPIEFGLRYVVQTWFHIAVPPVGEISPIFLLTYEIVTLVPILAATAIMARIEGRSVWDYGLTSPCRNFHFWAGWAGGFLCLSVLVGMLISAGYLVIDGVALHGVNAILYAFSFFIGFLLTGISEETTNRGYFQYALARGIGFWPGAVVSSAAFAFMHTNNHGETALGIAQVFCGGMIFCALLRVSGSLWMSIGFHAAWDWGQSYFYGTPDSAMLFKGHLMNSHALGTGWLSGGSAGPEGSALATPVLILGVLAIVWLTQRAKLTKNSSEIPA